MLCLFWYHSFLRLTHCLFCVLICQYVHASTYTPVTHTRIIMQFLSQRVSSSSISLAPQTFRRRHFAPLCSQNDWKMLITETPQVISTSWSQRRCVYRRLNNRHTVSKSICVSGWLSSLSCNIQAGRKTGRQAGRKTGRWAGSVYSTGWQSGYQIMTLFLCVTLKYLAVFN